MCKSPLTVWVGKGSEARQVQTACHECLQCSLSAIYDWVGRNIAESKTAVASHVFALTYGRDAQYGSVDHVRAAILTYSDVQKYLKLLRRHGCPVRYFVTGEYGGLKGRSHWHVVLHWQDKVPPLSGFDLGGNWRKNALGKRFFHHRLDDQGKPVYLDDDDQPTTAALGREALWWPHGFIHAKALTHHEVFYNCKYILKDQQLGPDEQRTTPKPSLLPPLGAAYFAGLARRHAEAGLAPQTLEYSFPEVNYGKNNDGENIVFRLSGRSAELYLDAFIAAWKEVQGDSPRPASQLVDEYQEWGRVINPLTFHYRPEPVAGDTLAQLEKTALARGPVVPPSPDRMRRKLAAMWLDHLGEAELREIQYRKWARDVNGLPLVWTDDDGKPLRDDKGRPLWVLLEDWIEWQKETPENPPLLSRKWWLSQ